MIKKAIACACVVTLSDVDFSSSRGDSPSSEEENARPKGRRTKTYLMLSIRSDNGTEFKNASFDAFCRDHGIEYQFSAP